MTTTARRGPGGRGRPTNTVLCYGGEEIEMKAAGRPKRLAVDLGRKQDVASPKGTKVPRPRSEGNPDRYSGQVGINVRARRDKLGLSAEDFLAKLKTAGCVVKLFTIYGWESGRNAIPLDALPAIAAALNTSVRKLLPTDE